MLLVERFAALSRYVLPCRNAPTFIMLIYLACQNLFPSMNTKKLISSFDNLVSYKNIFSPLHINPFATHPEDKVNVKVTRFDQIKSYDSTISIDLVLSRNPFNIRCHTELVITQYGMMICTEVVFA